MAVTYIFTPSTIIASAEVNQNFVDTDYTDIVNNRKIQWQNAATALSAYIKQDASDNLIVNNPDGTLAITADALDVTTTAILVTAGTNTIMYGGTNSNGTPNGDGFRFRYEATYGTGSGDYLVIEKTDGNQTSPDGGIIFVLTGNDGIVEESLEIAGDGSVIIHDANKVYFYNSADSVSTYLDQATNFSIVASASAGYFDVDFSAASGAMRLKAGTDCLIYNAANTEYIGFAMGSNFEALVTTGNFHIYDTDHDVHVRIYSDSLGSDYLDLWHDGTTGNIGTGGGDIHVTAAGGNFVLMGNTILTLNNAANTANTQIYTASTNDCWIAPEANGDVVVFAKEPRNVNGSANYQNVFRQTGWEYTLGGATAAITFPKAYSTGQVRVLLTSNGDKISAPTDESTNISPVGVLWEVVSVSSTGFQARPTQVAGLSLAGLYCAFMWESIGAP